MALAASASSELSLFSMTLLSWVELVLTWAALLVPTGWVAVADLPKFWFPDRNQEQHRRLLLRLRRADPRLLLRGRQHGEEGLLGHLEGHPGPERSPVHPPERRMQCRWDQVAVVEFAMTGSPHASPVFLPTQCLSKVDSTDIAILFWTILSGRFSSQTIIDPGGPVAAEAKISLRIRAKFLFLNI